MHLDSKAFLKAFKKEDFSISQLRSGALFQMKGHEILKQLRFNCTKRNLKKKSYNVIISLLLILSGSNLLLDIGESENTIILNSISDSQLSRTNIPERITSNYDNKESYIPDQFLINANLGNIEENLTRLYQSSEHEMVSSIFEDDLGRIWVVYSNFTGSNFWAASDSDICGQYTTDGGITWSAPKLIIDRPGGKEFGLSTTIDSEGKIWLFWFSTLTNGDNTDIWKSYSADNGVTWASPIQMTNNATVRDLHTSAFTTQNGTLWVVFAANRDGLQNLYYYTSPDNGVTWSSMKELPISDHGIQQQIQGNAYVTNNGTILLYGQEASTLWASFLYKSVDNGANWTKHKATDYDQHLNGGVYADENFNIFIVDIYLNGDNNLYITNSTNGGATWSTPEAISSSPGKSDDGIDFFLDSHGTLWTVFHSDRDGDFDLYYKKYVDFDLRPQVKFLNKWGSSGSGDGQFDGSRGIAINSTGFIYVPEQVNNRIQVFDENGNFIRKWGTLGSGDGQFNAPQDISINVTGYVYVTDINNARVQVFDALGNFVTKWGSSGSGDGQFVGPSGISINESGFVYVVDEGNHRIQVFDANGNFISKWGAFGSGDGQFNVPVKVLCDSTGRVYVSEWNNNRIQVFDANGNFITKWGSSGSGEGQFQNPWGISQDSAGNIYVVGHGNNRVQVFTSNGTFIAKWGSFGPDNGKFNTPHGIAINSTNFIYVNDMGNFRIQVFKETTGFFEPELPSFLTYYDDFNDGDISDWNINSGDWYVYNGMLRINNTDTGVSRHIKAPITAVGDWEVSVNAYWASGSYFEGILVFDANFSTTPQRFWSIFMSTYSGNMYKGVYYEINPFSADTKAENITAVSQGTWYKFSAKREGSTLFFYLNDNLMFTEYNAVDPGMEFALSSASFMPEVIYFDNFTVKYYESGVNSLPSIDSPANISYDEGTTSHSISWNPSDNDPASYNITRDGVLIKSGTWNSSGETITISVDGLSAGTYIYRCNVYDSVDQSTFDEVTVTVQPNNPPTIDSPVDVNYEVGQTGYSITWTPSDTDPGTYQITRNGSLLKSGSWNSSGETIVINVDGLGVGGYSYRCTVTDSIAQTAFDEVIVSVQPIPNPIPYIDSPSNYTYEEVTTGHSITWNPTDNDPSTYQITRNGTLIKSGTWNFSGEAITINIDGLPIGMHIYRCTVTDSETQSIYDEVEILIYNNPPLIDSPTDISYEENTTGFTITWNPSDTDPSSYEIWRNTTLIKTGPWNSSGEIITINVDGLSEGNYSLQCIVFDSRGQSISDDVLVAVTIGPPLNFPPTIDSPSDSPYEYMTSGHSIIWNPSDSNPESYQITRNGSLLTSGLWNSSSEQIIVSIDGLAPATYIFRCTVFDNGSLSVYDEVEVIVINSPPNIDTPSDVSYEENETGYEIVWNPLDSDPMSYQITRNGSLIHSGSWNSSGETIHINVDGLSPGIYIYRCLVFDSFSQSVFSDVTVHVTALPPVNLPPTLNSPMDIIYEEGVTGYAITWIASDLEDPDSYSIYRDGVLLLLGPWNSTGESITVNVDGLSYANYTYQCVVYDSLGQTATDLVNVIVTKSLEVPSPPQNLQAVAGDGQVDLSWDIPIDTGGAPIIEYRIYRSTSPSHYSLIGTSTTAQYLDNSVANGLTYYYIVRAVNVVGESLESNSVIVVPKADETTTTTTSTSTTTNDIAPNLTQGLTFLWIILPMLLLVVINHRRRKN